MFDRSMKPWLMRLAGSTPTVPICDEASGSTIWAKLEYMLPSGSTKDRVAAYVLSYAIEAGELTADSVVVEASSGSTSIAFAMACAMVGVRFRAVMPEGVSEERLLIIRRYGGEVVLTPKEGGVLGAIEETHRMAHADPSVFLPRQFDNSKNALAHQRTTGPELIAQVGGTVHGFVAGVGTGGTLMGIARALAEAGQRAHVARVFPERGTSFQNQPEICGGIPGVIDGLSTLLEPALIDSELRVSDGEAISAARGLCRRGFPIGPSSGLNYAAARKLALVLGPGKNIATVFSDRMERYFTTDLFRDFGDAALSSRR
jgi:cysteine synthase A